MDGANTVGGSRGLLRVIEKAGSSVHADLLRFYGVDLADLVRESPLLSPATVLGLVENLPMESATSCKLRDTPDGVGWGVHEFLTAGVIDAVRENTFSSLQMNSEKKLTPPDPVRLPGSEVESKKKSKANAFVRMAQKKLAQSRGD